MSPIYIVIILSLPLAHVGWIITQSGLLRPLRDRVSHNTLREGVHCSICTITQLSLIFAWLVPDVIPCPFPLSYLLKAMLLAKVSCIVYDMGEALGSLPLVMNSTESMGDMEGP